MINRQKTFDVFIAHASEDKDSFVRPLAIALGEFGVNVWFDEFSLRLGDSISRSIDKGLAQSRYGLVVISNDFIRKPWPEYEFRGLVTREVEEGRLILPIWHGVTRQQVVNFSPPLADKLALKTEDIGAEDIAKQILQEVRPDLYLKYLDGQIKRDTSEALRLLQDSIDLLSQELEETREELSEYRCPYCESPVTARIDAPVDEEQKDWDLREEFECGHVKFGGWTERPCPKDPRFPRFEDYNLSFQHNRDEKQWKWQCQAIGKTEMARSIYLPMGYGSTKEEAEVYVREHFERTASRANA